MIRSCQVELIKQRVEIVQSAFLRPCCPAAFPSQLSHQQVHGHARPAGTQPRTHWAAHQAAKLFLLLPSTSRQASLGLSHPWGSSGLAGRDLVTLGLLSFWQSSLGGTRTAQGGLWALPYLTVMQDSRIFFLLFSSFSLFFPCLKKHPEEEEQDLMCYVISEKHVLLLWYFTFVSPSH